MVALASSIPASTSRRRLHRRIWEHRWCYVFALPAVVLAAMFTFYPTIMSWYISFLDWSGLHEDSVWVGLGNYTEVVTDRLFWEAFGRSFLFAGITVPVKMILGFIAALVLNDASLRLRPLFRVLFFLPVVTITAIVGVIWSLILNPFDGPLNAVLTTLQLVPAPVDFLGDPDLALFAVAGVYVWKGMGMTMIYWLVALQTVPSDLYEAARVDGASSWRMHRDITVPLVTPFAVVILLMSFVSALQTFPLVQAMTGGGPALATELVEVYIYRIAFGADVTPRLGYASAVAVFFGVTVLALTLIQVAAVQRAASVRKQIGKT